MTAISMFALLYNIFFLGEMAGTEPSAIQQESGLMSANVGDTVISTIYKYDKVGSGQEINHLSNSDMKSSDLATYYCWSAHSNVVEFKKITIYNIKGTSHRASVQPGASVTLNCTIHTETCAGEHSVYWFRHGSGESCPGIIYTHGDRSDQCEKSPEAGSPTQSCVFNLPKRNLSLSDAGTYYCAVASCGEILFGKGIKLDIDHDCKEDHLLLVYSLCEALALCFILIIVLGCDKEHDDTLISVHYATLNVIHKKPKTQRQRSTMERDTVYCGVRCQNKY
uniref:Ig-like domain-containing protein n=1 Tax=Hucho hucho TaxID=62062 RepID=A0A4W5JME7_9TELE